MKFLVALSCVLAVACAKPSVVAPISYTYGSHLLAGNVAPLAYSYTAGAPLAHTAYAAPIAYNAYTTPIVQAVAPVVTKTQYHSQDTLGQAAYGHSEPLQAHNAVQDAAGNKVGAFSYVAPTGEVISTNYVADALGYRVASNALPVAPAALPIAPADTPEVVAARIAHLNEHALARSRSRRSVVAPIAYSTPLAYSSPLAYSATPYVHSGLGYAATSSVYGSPLSAYHVY